MSSKATVTSWFTSVFEPLGGFFVVMGVGMLVTVLVQAARAISKASKIRAQKRAAMNTENTSPATAFAAPAAGFYEGSILYPQPGEAPGLSMYSGRTVEATAAGVIDHLALIGRDVHVMASIVDPATQHVVIDSAGTPAEVATKLQAFITGPAPAVERDFLSGITACPISTDADCEACQ